MGSLLMTGPKSSSLQIQSMLETRDSEFQHADFLTVMILPSPPSQLAEGMASGSYWRDGGSAVCSLSAHHKPVELGKRESEKGFTLSALPLGARLSEILPSDMAIPSFGPPVASEPFLSHMKGELLDWSRVLQESVLGPLLVDIFTDDLNAKSRNALMKFADIQSPEVTSRQRRIGTLYRKIWMALKTGVMEIG